MGIFDVIETDETIEEATDSVGGFTVLESAIYNFTIERAFVTLSVGKAMALNVHFKGTGNTVLRQSFWVTSGEAKGCKNFYINQKTGKKHYLPGYNQANALCLIASGKELKMMDTKKATVNLYDSAQHKEVPTEVDLLSDLTGKVILAGVINQTVDKRAKNPNTGTYEPTGETKSENEVDKLFRAKDGLTVVEIKAQKTEPLFKEKWITNWEGKVKDKTSKVAGIPGAPKRETGKQAPATSLFT